MTSINHSYPEWMSDPAVSDIPKEKLAFLNRLYLESQGKDQKQLLATLLPLLKEAKEKNLTLSSKELSIAITAIKKYSSAEEQQKIEKLLHKSIQ